MALSSMVKLSDRLQQQLQAEQEALQNQTTELLKQHSESLKKLSSVGLATTKAVTDRQHEQLQQNLLQLHRKIGRCMRWMLLWPVLVSLVVCLLMLCTAGLYSWRTTNQAEDQLIQTRQLIKKLEAQFCATPAGRQSCKTK